MARRKVTYRPSKSQGVFGIVWGSIFIVIGLAVVVPSFGPFGVLWTLMAVGITAYNAYCAFGKGYVGPEISIEDDSRKDPDAATAEARLQDLRGLYDRSLITEAEYEEKRQEILKDL